jgi:hypothetical protein
MEYKLFEQSSDSKVIGIKDGSSQALLTDETIDRHQWLKKFMWLKKGESWMDLRHDHINRYEGDIVFEFKKQALLTDTLRTAPFIYGVEIVSSRMKSLLEEYILDDVQFRKIKLVDQTGKKIDADYYLMQMPFLSNDQIDWTATLFYDFRQAYARNFTGYDFFRFNDSSEYDPAKAIGLFSGSIVFKEDPPYDMINTKLGLVFSGRLCVSIEEYNLTNVILSKFICGQPVHHFSEYKTIRQTWEYK